MLGASRLSLLLDAYPPERAAVLSLLERLTSIHIRGHPEAEVRTIVSGPADVVGLLAAALGR